MGIGLRYTTEFVHAGRKKKRKLRWTKSYTNTPTTFRRAVSDSVDRDNQRTAKLTWRLQQHNSRIRAK